MAMHAPIQILGLIIMIGGMAIGIRIGNDLDFLEHPIHAHVIIGLLVVCIIIVFQPDMGILQHRYFTETGGRSIFAYLHRWTGRCAIGLGMINSGLGFQPAKANVVIPTRSYVRNYVLLGVIVFIWFSFVVYDESRRRHPEVVHDREEREQRAKQGHH